MHMQPPPKKSPRAKKKRQQQVIEPESDDSDDDDDDDDTDNDDRKQHYITLCHTRASATLLYNTNFAEIIITVIRPLLHGIMMHVPLA